VCKRDTFKRLQLKAAKLGGLVGVTFDVTRIGDKSPAVGSDYDFVGKNTMAEISQGTGVKIEDLVPFNYADVIKYFPANELRKMGFGTGTQSASSSSVGSADTKAMAGAGEQKNVAGQTASASIFGSKPFDPAKEL
jgi:hypothetical protein